MPKPTATAEESSDSTANELEAFFDNEDADVSDIAGTEVEETESEESEPEVEDEEVQTEETKEESEPASEEESEETTEDADAQVEESQEEESEQGEPEEDTASNEQTEEKTQQQLAHEAFKRREAERKLREAEERREAEHLKNYLDSAKDDDVELAKRQLEVESYLLNKEKSFVNNEKLDVGIQKAVNDLGLAKMDDTTKQFIARQLDKFEATNVIRDQAGNVVEVRGDVYQYLKEEMDSIQQFRSIGAREQTKKKTVEKTRTVPKPTRTPKEKPTDDGLDAFTEEANKW